MLYVSVGHLTALAQTETWEEAPALVRSAIETWRRRGQAPRAPGLLDDVEGEA